MRTNLPLLPAGQRRSAGLTILEMLVSSAMLALIIVGLTAMFIQTQKAFKTGIKQTDVSDTGRSIVQMIASDLEQLSDGQAVGGTNAQGFGATNFMWSWSNGYPQFEDQEHKNANIPFRTNQLQGIYMLAHTNTGWTGIGYAVSNVIPGLGVGTLYRYLSPTNRHNFASDRLYGPFTHVFDPAYKNLFPPLTASPVRLSRIADGVVHLKIRVYDNDGNQVGYETNYGVGEFNSGQISNSYPAIYTLSLPRVTNNLPSSIDLELGILEPDAWEHLKTLGDGSTTPTPAQTKYLETAANKVEIFRQRVFVRAAALQ